MRSALPVSSARTPMSPPAKWFGGFATLTLALGVASLLAFSQTAAAQSTAASSSSAVSSSSTSSASSSSAAASSSAQPAAPSAAQSSTAAPEACTAQSNELLDDLLANGTLTHKQYNTLKEHNEEQCAAQAAATRAQTMRQAREVEPSMSGVGFHSGNFDVAISGEVNGYYIHNRPMNVTGTTGQGCLLCQVTSGGTNSSQVSDGMIPGWVFLSLSTHQGGWDESVDFGVWASISSVNQSGLGVNFDSGASVGLGNAGIDFRQQYMTFGRHNVGTFKVGRDIGMFGAEAILNDMALFGVGTVSGVGANSTLAKAPGPGEMAAGRIGSGYIYTDFMPQITYASPTIHGVSAQFGVFQPLSDAVATSLGVTSDSAPLTANTQPMLQFKLSYETPAKSPVDVKLWFNVLTQKMEANASDVAAETPTSTVTMANPTTGVVTTTTTVTGPSLLTLGQSFQANGEDYGGKLTAKGFSFVASGYNGSGMGTTGLFMLATSPSGAPRTSHGYYVQALYNYKKWTLGVSDGMSALLPANAEDPANPATTPVADQIGIVRDNALWIVQLRYSVGSWANVIAEYDHNESESSNSIVGTKAFNNTNTSTSDSAVIGVVAWF